MAIVLLVLSAVWTSNCDRSDPSIGEIAAGEPGPELDQPPGQLAPTTVIRGTVWRELPRDEDVSDGETAGGAADDQPKPSAAALADPNLAAMLAEVPAWKLEPPGTTDCRVRAWQAGELVSGEVPCAPTGDYELELTAGITGVVHVEILVAGHLRGLIEANLDPTDADVPADQAAGQAAGQVVDGVRTIDLVSVALGPGHVVSGQTVDARGEPLANVQVQALPRPSLDEAIPWRTVSDAQGRFEFTTLPYGPLSLRAIKPGFALSVVEAISPEDEVLMVLDALIDLEGAVVASPDLLARAVVRLEGSSVWPAVERSLAHDGSFVFEQLADGIYGVEVTVPASEPGGPEFASVPLENVTPDLRVSLALVPAFRVPVRVVDPEGEAIAGARVTLGYSQIGMLQKTAETDADGRTLIGPVVPGPYFVHADADGYLPPEAVEVDVGMQGFEGPEQVVVLIRPAKLEGIVVDEDDRPVAGAEVVLDSEVAFSVGEGDTRRRMFAAAIGASDGSLGVTKGAVLDIPLFAEDEEAGGIGVIVTDEHGRFEIDSLLPGSYRIWATHGEHAGSAVTTLELRSGEVHTNLRLQLREGVPLTGVVRSENGQALVGIQIDLGDGMILTTDDRGVFDAGFRRGEQELILRGVGMIPKRVAVELGDAPMDLEVELAPATGRFEGRVVDGNHQPIADVEVELRPLDGLSPSLITWTDARGLYGFDELAPGRVKLEFSHGAHVPAASDAVVDERAGLRHELVLDAGWAASVLVRSAVRGDPIANVELLAGHAKATTDNQGSASLSQLVGDAVKLELRAPGWVDKTIELRHDGTGLVRVTVELTEGGSISGTIDDDVGDPVASATIEVRSLRGELLGSTRSDGRGEWFVDGIPAGDVVVRAEPPSSGAAVLAPVELRSDIVRGEVTKAVRLRFERL
ncbi:carboxypeptidase-like regulatory domain-containing protein [Enhygromyxa salina]|uniref:Nickel uptake substrate-specific transmembrane region n=1 Tax=Enhygromyxa salina TaxID=215803 RepID=A0A2S9YWK4_9BACT|nr:carboxypeptidase-like regulatory domain-containing protein [Enhygromyxa salina]PRQ09470.1 Nickel uptake substrate-specific transmembrane region [Enhygromyxa salina]